MTRFHPSPDPLLDRNVDNFNGVPRLVFLVAPHIANLVHYIHALDNSAKDCVLVIQPGLRREEREEKAVPVCVRRKIEHIALAKKKKKTLLTVGTVVMKNCEPLVLGPALAMLTV